SASYYNDGNADNKSALDNALSKAGEDLKNKALTQAAADADAQAIKDAINGLKGQPTSLDNLNQAISQGEAAKNSASYYNDGNADNKSALDNALSKAGEDLKNKALTQAAADADAQAIKDAINGLKGQPTSLDNLNQAISQGEAAKNSASYYNDGNADNKSALDNALSKAGEDLKNKALTQAAADADAQAIKDAINGLKGQPTSLDNLNQAISQGEAAKNSASYYNDGNADNKSALDNALSKAGEDLKNKALTQAAADADAQAIKDAINGLKGQPTSLDNLNQAISQGTSAQAGSKYANSSDNSKAALDQAIKAGKTAQTQSGLTQKEADADASAIEKAINGLSGKETDKTALTDAINKGHKTQTDSSDYQDTSDAKRRQLDKDITDAETLNQDPKASQSNVDAAAKKISDDINNLNQGTDAANNKPVIPSTKTPVSDNSHLTDDEKSQVKDNVQESNPAGKVTNVDDQGNTTITYPDGSKNVVSGKDTTTGTSKDNLNKSIDSGNNTKSSGNYNNTSDQNRDDLDKAIKHGQDVVNDPHASQKDIDNATKAINKAIDNVNNGQTDASKNKPVIPSTKTPVSDNSHLTDDEKGQVKDNVQESNPAGKVTNVDDQGNTTITYPDGSKNTISGDQVTTVIITGDDYTYDDYAYNDFYQVIIKASAVQVYTLPKGNLTKEKKLAHGTTLTVLETKKIDGQVWYRIGTNRWIMAATTIKVGELENFKLKRLSKKTKTTATVWVNKLAIYNNVNGKMTKKHLTRGTKVRIYAIATINGGEWYKIGKNKWIPAAGVHELTVEPL
ncbi:SLAP domain-containing protein, partial [Lactobacillus amylovorus]